MEERLVFLDASTFLAFRRGWITAVTPRPPTPATAAWDAAFKADLDAYMLGLARLEARALMSPETCPTSGVEISLGNLHTLRLACASLDNAERPDDTLTTISAIVGQLSHSVRHLIG